LPCVAFTIGNVRHNKQLGTRRVAINLGFGQVLIVFLGKVPRDDKTA